MKDSNINIQSAKVFQDLYKPARYKVFYGGRGAGKSYAIRDYLIIKSLQERCRIGCFREIQNTIRDSSYKLIKDGIIQYNLQDYFDITLTEIRAKHTGSEFIFKGLRYSVDEIKSTEGIKYAWVEEAQNVSNVSWDVLIPTIRTENSEIIVSFNPNQETDATYQKFIANPLPQSIVKKVNYWDNPFFPNTLKLEMAHDKKTRYEDYLHIWEGECITYSEAQVFNNKFEVASFEINKKYRWFLGADWGFSQDPTAIIACYIDDGSLFIRYEAGGIGIELDELPALFDSLNDPNNPWTRNLIKKNVCYADSARPETISYIHKKGYQVYPCDKWAGSIEDGIAYLKSFNKIYIHPDCKHTADEFRLYSYKQDKNTGEVLPIVIDKNNHYIDAIRYALCKYIKGGFNDYASLFKGDIG